jgi:DNA-binding transcriptional LysR family regulator
MDSLTGMRAFVRVVESGSFTRASELLKMPKSTLTKAIQTLEADLRIKLLSRTTRRVVVTPDGAAYYERLVRLLDEFDDLNGSMASTQASPSGRLRIEMGERSPSTSSSRPCRSSRSATPTSALSSASPTARST